MWRVRYNGIFGPVERQFDTEERAEQWVRQVGRYRNPATVIEEVTHAD